MKLTATAIAALALGVLSIQAQSSSTSPAVSNSTSATSAASAANSTSTAQASSSNSSATLSDNLPSPSSNYTLPAPNATATLPPGFVVQQSTPFVFTKVDTDDIPDFKYSLLNESQSARLQLCDEQVKFCTKAGCADPEATIDKNFCNTETMGVACTCNKGASNLNQWKWPVQFADCLNRGSSCKQMCLLPKGTTSERYACREACDKAFGGTCGFPNQYAANYAVSKVSAKPKLTMIQGGNANSASRLAQGAVASVGLLVAALLLV